MSASGILSAMAIKMPAVTVESNLWSCRLDLYFIIILDTVIGMPDEVIVISNPTTDNAI